MHYVVVAVGGGGGGSGHVSSENLHSPTVTSVNHGNSVNSFTPSEQLVVLLHCERKRMSVVNIVAKSLISNEQSCVCSWGGTKPKATIPPRDLVVSHNLP